MKPEHIGLKTYVCHDGRFMQRTWVRENEHSAEDVTGSWFVKFKDYNDLYEKRQDEDDPDWQPIETCPEGVMVVFWLPLNQKRVFGYKDRNDASGKPVYVQPHWGEDNPKFWYPLPSHPPV